MRLCQTILLVAGATFAAAQPRALDGLRTGVVFDQPTGTLRPVLGVPGASRLGSALPGRLTASAVAPGAQFALVIENGKLALWRNLLAESVDSIPLAEEEPSVMAWAPDGSAAAIYFPASGTVQMLRPSHEPSLSVVTTLDAAPAALSISAGGSTIAAIVADSLLTFSERSQPEVIAGFTPAAIAFSRTGELYGVGLHGRVFRIESGSAIALSEVPDDPAKAPGVAIVGQILHIADAAHQEVRRFDLRDSAWLPSIALDAAPIGITPLSNDVLLVLTERGNSADPLYVIDTRREPAAFFVPAGDQQ